MIVAQIVEGETPGGAERLIIQFGLELRRRGHDMVTVSPERSGEGWLGKELRARGFIWQPIKPRPMVDLRVVRDLVKTLRSLRADALHSHEFLGVYGGAAAWVMNKPHVITLHGSPYFAQRWQRRMAFKWAARHATKLVGVAQDTSDHAEQVLGLPKGFAQTIPNGVAANPGNPETLRRELGARPDELLVVALGNVSERKNHIQLLDALVRLHARRPEVPWRMVVAGQDRGCMAAIHALAGQHGLGGRVHLLGHRSDTEDVLAAADVFAMSSLHEGMPLAIIEAMHAKKPVISTTAGGIADMMTDGSEGLLVPVSDTDALSAGLERLLTDAGLRTRMGEAGAVRAARQFGIGPMMDAYLGLYATNGSARHA